MNKKIHFINKNSLFWLRFLYKVRNYYLRMKEFDIRIAVIIRENIKMNDKLYCIYSN